jgi:hypothetical protein
MAARAGLRAWRSLLQTAPVLRIWCPEAVASHKARNDLVRFQSVATCGCFILERDELPLLRLIEDIASSDKLACRGVVRMKQLPCLKAECG